MSRLQSIEQKFVNRSVYWNSKEFSASLERRVERFPSTHSQLLERNDAELFFRARGFASLMTLGDLGILMHLEKLKDGPNVFYAEAVCACLCALKQIILLTDRYQLGYTANSLGQLLLPNLAYANEAVLDKVWELGLTAVTGPNFHRFIPDPKILEGIDMEYAPQQLIVLTMGLLAARHDQEIDWNSYHIPADRFYVDFVREGVFNEDLEKYDQWMKAACDKHLDIVSLDIDDEPRNFGHELGKEIFWLWPLEIRAVERFRRERGLPTPEIDHPLMRTKLAAITEISSHGVVLPQWQYDRIDGMVHFDDQFAFLQDIWPQP